jgi:acetyl-CoA carboxylase carboxyltransferase component
VIVQDTQARGPEDVLTRARLTPRERLELLCDPGSIHYLRTAVVSDRMNGRVRPGDGVLAASGSVHGRPIICYAQDGSYVGGSVGEHHADTIVRLLGLAQRTEVPLVGFLDSAGARLQEGVAALAGYGRMFRQIVASSRTVPQISVICGACAGGGSYAPALTDFVLMQLGSQMFLTGPRVVEQAVGERVAADELGGPRVHSQNGVCHLVAASPVDATSAVQRLLAYLPTSVGTEPPIWPERPPSVTDLDSVVPRESRRAYDVRDVLRGVLDADSLMELWSRWARNMVTAFGLIGGRSVGIVANQPRHLGGLLNAEASEKAARFVSICDRFRIPLLVVVDTPGFMPGHRSEAEGIIRHGADLVRAFAAATVPRVTLVLRKAFGGSYIAMNCKDLGADLAFAWPQAEIGIMGASQAATIIGPNGATRRPPSDEALAAYSADHLSADHAAAGGFIDEVIPPAQSRASIEWAFRLMRERAAGAA